MTISAGFESMGFGFRYVDIVGGQILVLLLTNCEMLGKKISELQLSCPEWVWSTLKGYYEDKIKIAWLYIAVSPVPDTW